MVAHVLRLKLAVLGNTFRRPRRQVIGMTVALVGAVWFGAFIVIVVGSLSAVPTDIARAMIIVIGSVVTLGFVVLPFAFGADEQLDPTRFRWFAISPNRLALVLGIGALVSLPLVGVAALSVAQAAALGRSAPSVIAGVLSIPLILATCVLFGRVSAATAAHLLWTRRARDLAGVVVLGVVAALAALGALLATLDWDSHAMPIIRRIAAVLTWTPLGAMWSIPADAADGRAGEAWAKGAIAIAVLAVLALVWRLLVGYLLTSHLRTESRRRYWGLGWFERVPATAFGVIAARSLAYWGRDGRYLVTLAVVPIVPVLVTLALIVAGVPAAAVAWIPLPVMCLFLGWSVHNDLAHDSSAFWLHLSTSTSGAADRLGRVIPPLLIGAPLIAVGSLVTGLLVGDLIVALPVAGIAVCALLSALGVASVSSVLAPYPTVHPGDSPFVQPQTAGSGGSLTQTIAFALPILITAPVVWFAVAAYGTIGGAWAAFGIGVAVGAVVLAGGAAWGGAVVNRRSPELLEFTLQS